MDRRAFLGTLALVAVPGGVIAQTPPKTWRIGFGGSSAIPDTYGAAFRAGLAAFGLSVKQNVSIEYRTLGERLSPSSPW